MRRVPRAASVMVATVAAFALWSPALAATRRVRLPSMAATIQARIDAEGLLRGGRGPERTLPGPAVDRERVTVAVTPGGVAQSVTVEQTLEVRGVGDYFVKIPGPVTSASALPTSTAQPGLRSGSVVWQGFASDGETLAARVGLLPQREQDRLPLSVDVSMTVDGRPADIDGPVDGRLHLAVIAVNETGVPIDLPSAEPAPGRAPAALAAVRRALEKGRRPQPGTDGVPRFVPATSSVEERTAIVRAPVAAEIAVELDGDIRGVVAPGARVDERGSSTRITRASILSGDRSRLPLTVDARVVSGRIDIELTARPVPPPAAEATVRASSRERAALDRLVTVMAEVARLPDVDAYLGNPDRDGVSATVYRYVVVAPEAAPDTGSAPPRTPRSFSWMGFVVAILLLLVIVAGLAAWWALS